MVCEYCEDNEHKEIIYQDDEVVVAVKDTVATPGQITIFPRKHLTILEMVPENILAKCVNLANKVSTAVFEALGAQGTNIIINNGLGAGQKVPHFALEVIPRREGDGLNFQWEPKQLMEDEMDGAFQDLKEDVSVSKESLPESSPLESKPKEEKKEEVKKIEKAEKSEHYMAKVLRRRP